MCKKIVRQPDWDENMWENYEEKVYTENININLKNFGKIEIVKLIEKKKLTFKWEFHSSELLNSAPHKMQ